MIYNFSDEKNEILFKERGITFQHVIDSISENGILLDFKHPNIMTLKKLKLQNLQRMVVMGKVKIT